MAYNVLAMTVVTLYSVLAEKSTRRHISKETLLTVMTQGLIEADYEMFGHRDGRLYTSCPGDDLYVYIHGWPHYSTRPIHKYGAERSTSRRRNSVASRQIINVFTSADSSDVERDDSVVQQL